MKVHRLKDIDTENKIANCAYCGPVQIRPYYRKSGGWRCSISYELNGRKRGQSRPYIIHKGDVCERCGFIPEHSSQLDIDHKDSNHSNNERANLWTLCANCHRLVTRMRERA